VNVIQKLQQHLNNVQVSLGMREIIACAFPFEFGYVRTLLSVSGQIIEKFGRTVL